MCGSGSSVSIATDYGLDGPGSNPGGDEIFRLSRPALGPTQPPLKWVPAQQIRNTTCCYSTLIMQRIESVTVLNVTLARKV